MKIKSFFTTVVVSFILIALSSCSKQEKWEYKELSFYGISSSYMGEFYSKDVYININELNELGQEGWEVISMCPILETVHPNYGNDKYVTGLQPNTRTMAIKILLKRRAQETKKEVRPDDSVVVDTAVVVEEVAVVDSCCGDSAAFSF